MTIPPQTHFDVDTRHPIQDCLLLKFKPQEPPQTGL